jgi:hypothetical protein
VKARTFDLDVEAKKQADWLIKHGTKKHAKKKKKPNGS